MKNQSQQPASFDCMHWIRIITIIAVIVFFSNGISSCFYQNDSSSLVTKITNEQNSFNSKEIGATVHLNGIFAGTSPEAYQEMNNFYLSMQSNEQWKIGMTTMMMEGKTVFLEDGTIGEVVQYTWSSGTCVLVKSGVHSGNKVWVFDFDLN